MADLDELSVTQKAHRKRHAGRKAEKKSRPAHSSLGEDKAEEEEVDRKKLRHDPQSAKDRNPKAFTFKSVKKGERQFRRTSDLKAKKHHIPVVDRTPLEPPPLVVAVVGPPKVGKTTLLTALIRNFTRQKMTNITGPVTVVSAKKRRLTFIECGPDISTMIDVAKIADIALLLVDAKFGFEMETFEFLNICQVHGFPRIMGVLTHLDEFKTPKQSRKAKKALKHRFWTEIYPGAKLFYLSQMKHGTYLHQEVKNLGRFINVLKLRPLQWRNSHSYMLADRMEDLTSVEEIRRDQKCDRSIAVFGYLRGVHLKPDTMVHLPGCGDFLMKDISLLPDPCPLPDALKKRSLNERERLVFAPMSGMAGLIIDKDAVYIQTNKSQKALTDADGDGESDGKQLLSSLLQTESTLDSKMQQSKLKVFSDQEGLVADDFSDSDQEGHSSSDEEDEAEVSDDEGSVASDGSNEIDEERDHGPSSLSEEVIEDDESSRKRRKVHFADTGQEKSSSKNEPIRKKIKDTLRRLEGKDTQEWEEEESEEEEGVGVQWKKGLAERAAKAFYERQENGVSLRKLVYGRVASVTERSEDPKKISASARNQEEEEEDEEENLGGLFRIAQKKRDVSREQEDWHGRDTSKMPRLLQWDENGESLVARIRDCFVTGKWKESEDAATLLAMDKEDDEDDVFGDFEDLETGERSSAAGGGKDEEEAEPISEEDAAKARAEKKAKLKAMFDAQYDEGKGDEDFFEGLKRDLEEQAKLNRSEFQDLDPSLRLQYEGYSPGMYVRIQLEKIPAELVLNFDARDPLILGGLTTGEENIGCVQIRMKKHRWYKRILKNRDPLIMSVGWRRFQTLPLYSMQDHNMRHRLLKYTPQHLHCMATFWGPITPQNSGVLAVQALSHEQADFRIAATGTVLNLDKSVQIMKKLKIVGTPQKIYKKTAFIQGMFTTPLEAAKFEGAAVRTVSGIRGQIKHAERKPPGVVRCTFEDKILLSDIVFLRSWVPVEIPRLYHPLPTLLVPRDQRSNWTGMKTVGQLKKEAGIKVDPNPDNLYVPVERKTRTFAPLSVPTSLQRALPFDFKPKKGPKDPKESIENQRIAVVMEPKEQKISRLMESLRAMNEYKQEKQKQALREKAEQNRKRLAKDEARQTKRQKELRKRVFKELGKIEARKKNARAKKHGGQVVASSS